MTLEEINISIAAVDSAILSLIQGKQLFSFKTGSGNFYRDYGYGEITLDSLREYRNELISMRQTLENAKPSFNTSGCFKITGTK